MSVFMVVPNCFDCHRIIVNFEIRNVSSQMLFFFSKKKYVLTISGHLIKFHNKFRANFLSEKSVEILMNL